MRALLAILLLTMLPAACAADTTSPVLLRDREAEVDLIVTGIAGTTSVQQISGPPDARQYVAVADVHVDQVLKGDASFVNTTIEVALAGRTALADSADAHLEELDTDAGVWFLRESPPEFPAPYIMVWRTKPDVPENMSPYANDFAQASAAMDPWSGVRMELTLPSQVTATQEDIAASVRIYSTDPAHNTLPQSVPWQDSIYIIVVADVDPYLPFADHGSAFTREPRLAVLAIHGDQGDEIPAVVPSAPGVTADATLMSMDMPALLTQPTTFTAYARLLGPENVSLVAAAPVTVTIAP